MTALLLAPAAVSAIALGIWLHQTLIRRRVRRWVAESPADRTLAGCLMLHVAGDDRWQEVGR